MLISSATSSVRTNSVVGIPFRAQTVARAIPKFPPPMTATRTGYGGGMLLEAFMDRPALRLLGLRLIAFVATNRCALPISREFRLKDENPFAGWLINSTITNKDAATTRRVVHMVNREGRGLFRCCERRGLTPQSIVVRKLTSARSKMLMTIFHWLAPPRPNGGPASSLTSQKMKLLGMNDTRA